MIFRKSGSAGGHNGLKSLIGRLGSDAFPRLRLGVGGPEAGIDLIDHVLMPFLGEDAAKAEALERRLLSLDEAAPLVMAGLLVVGVGALCGAAVVKFRK